MGHKIGISAGLNNFHNVSLGQGQEIVAENAMEIAANNGHWVVLQVIITIFLTLFKIIGIISS